MVKTSEQQLSLGLRVEDFSPLESADLIRGHEDVRESIGTWASDEGINEEIERQLGTRLEAHVDPNILGQLRAVPLDNLRAGLRLFMLWSPAEGKTSKELRERFSEARNMELPLDSYSGLNTGDLRNYFGRYALALEVVARERCPEYLNGILKEKERFQYIR